MKISVDRKLFKEAIDVTSVAATKEEREGTQMYATMVVKVNGDTASIMSTNGSAMCWATIPVQVTEQDDVNVSGVLHSRFKQFIEACTSESVNLTLGSDYFKANGGKGRTVPFPAINLDAYPFFEDFVKSATAIGTIPAKTFKEALSVIKPFVGDDSARPHFMVTENRESKDGGSHFIACNGNVMATYQMDDVTHMPLSIPQEQVQGAQQFLANAEADTEITVSSTDNYFIFSYKHPVELKDSFGNVTISGDASFLFGFSKAKAEFPKKIANYPLRMDEPSDKNCLFTFSKDDIKRAVVAVMAPLSANDNSVMVTVQPSSDPVNPSYIRITSKAVDADNKEAQWDVTEDVNVTHGKGASILLDKRNLLAVLALLSENVVQMAIDDSVQFSERRDNGTINFFLTRKKG